MIDISSIFTTPSAKLRIAEIFASVQGEGIWAGVPSTFVRVSGCNLRCVWCDTPYASWEPEGPVEEVDAIVDRVNELQPQHAVITGGEPMVFQAVETLARRLKDLGYTITIETAGTVFRELPCDLMSISPKLTNSIPIGTEWALRHDNRRIDLEALANLITTYPVQLKFVVQNPRDLAEIDELVAELPPVEPENILLMPEGRDSVTLWNRARELVPLCVERGWRLAPRIQIDLFGDTRGT